MKLPAFLDGVPRVAFLLAVPLVAFLATIAISLGTSNDSKPPASLSVQVSNTQTLPTPTVVALATPTPAPNRQDCAKISGTSYQSPDEQQWFKDNCNGATARASTGSASSNSSSGGSASSGQTTAGVTRPSGGGAQSPIGDTLVIPAAGVNADVWRADVTSDGYMPDPVGYFNVVWYDFRALAGAGGYVDSGNLVMAAHVDCAYCHNGGSGTAAFWSVRYLQAGDTATYYTHDGKSVRYVVVSSVGYDSSANWSAIVASTAADMTLITCDGVFNPATHEYDLRHVVRLRKA